MQKGTLNKNAVVSFGQLLYKIGLLFIASGAKLGKFLFQLVQNM